MEARGAGLSQLKKFISSKLEHWYLVHLQISSTVCSETALVIVKVSFKSVEDFSLWLLISQVITFSGVPGLRFDTRCWGHLCNCGN